MIAREQPRTTPVEPIRRIETVWIPMTDGTRLAATIWLPRQAGASAPVPAIVEYIPYRRRDFTRVRDSMIHPFFAERGYASVRVDLRGSGDSEGLLTDEYLQQELDDGLDVLSWLGEQEWCTGNVGIIGISWGGFNGLQLAALQPPELRAVISLCSTDDRYSDDIHHMGGCLLGDNLSWASVMFSYNSMPPDPAVVGERWRAQWHQRLEGSGLWLDTWLRHQRRDDYWKHGSICEDYERVQVPVYLISGWADGYSNAVFRMLEHLGPTSKGLIGPWSHKYPHIGVPGPAIDFLSEAVRWWDRWIKGKETGIADEPRLRVWMQDSVPPTTSYDRRPGRWVAEPSWPPPHTGERIYVFGHRRLLEPDTDPVEEVFGLQSPLSLGLFAGKWCSYAAGPDLAHDQRQEDGGALCFDTDPLPEQVEILGAPEVALELESDRPVAMVAVRISDIAPDNKATRVSYGLLNLTHRESSEEPAPLEPGRRYRVRVRLNHIAQVFPAGHRIRVAVSSSYWPLAWPAPSPAHLRLFTAGSALSLPVRQPRLEDEALARFGEPVVPDPVDIDVLEAGRHNWLVHRDLASDHSTLEVINDHGRKHIPAIGLTIGFKALEWYSSRADDFSSIRGETRLSRTMSRGDWSIRTVAHTVLTSSGDHFELDADLDAFENGKRVFCRTWNQRIPRDLV